MEKKRYIKSLVIMAGIFALFVALASLGCNKSVNEFVGLHFAYRTQVVISNAYVLILVLNVLAFIGSVAFTSRLADEVR